MSHTATEPPGRRRLEIVGGSVIVALGVIALLVALQALRHPGGREVAAAKERIATDSAGNAISTDDPGAASSTSTAGASSSRATTAAASSGASATDSSKLKQIPVVILNSTTTNGLAETAKQRLTSGGWTVSSVGNLVNNIASTCVYYDPSDSQNEQAAQLLQSQFPSIKRVKEKFSGLPSGALVLVLTSDYS